MLFRILHLRPPYRFDSIMLRFAQRALGLLVLPAHPAAIQTPLVEAVLAQEVHGG